MDKILFDIILLVSSGVLWILITLLFRGRIKKFWLYTLFAYPIYGITPYIVVYRFNLPYVYVVYTSLSMAIITIIYILRIITSRFSLKDTLILPQTLNLLTMVILLTGGVG